MNTEIEKLIQTAPLTEIEKKQLIELLSAEGESDKFFKEFNDLLIQTVEAKRPPFEVATKNFDHAYAQEEKKLAIKLQALQSQLANKVQQLSSADLQERLNLIDEFDLATEKCEQESARAQHSNLAKTLLKSS